MLDRLWRRMGFALVGGLLVSGVLSATPVDAQRGPIIPIIPTFPVGLPGGISPVIVGFPGSEQHGIDWSTSGRADVDVDIDHSQQRGRVIVP
jgi:hypothetical protein